MAKLCPPSKYDRALDLYEADAYEGLVELEKLAEKYPKDVEVRYALGTGYLDIDLPREALPHLEWVAKRDLTPDRRDALAAAYVRLGMVVHAERTARRDVGFAHGSSPDGVDASMSDFPESMAPKDRLSFERLRFEIFGGDLSAVGRMQALSERFPDYMPGRNLVATGAFLLGDMGRYKVAANAALELKPHDLYALLNSVRLALLEDGVDGARALRRQVMEAPQHGDVMGGEIARAQALAYMDDAPGVAWALKTVDALERLEAHTAMPVVATLEHYLAEREADPDAPLLRAEDLLQSFLSRWATLDEADVEAAVSADLASMPGLLGLLPRVLGYEDAETARFIAAVLLSDAFPPSGPEPWSEVIRRVAQQGPGTSQTRMLLLSLLVELEKLPPGEALAFEGRDAGIEIMEVEISGEPVPSGLSADDQPRLEAALKQLQEGDAAQAMAELTRLHDEYPESISVTFNLALSEQAVGGAVAERARPRLERLVAENPEYLFAKAHLALSAIDAGDLERAGALLRMPETRRRFYAVEYATFTTAMGMFMLANGDVDGAEQALMAVGKLVGKEAAAYRTLQGRIAAHVQGPHAQSDPSKGSHAESGQLRDELE